VNERQVFCAEPLARRAGWCGVVRINLDVVEWQAPSAVLEAPDDVPRLLPTGAGTEAGDVAEGQHCFSREPVDDLEIDRGEPADEARVDDLHDIGIPVLEPWSADRTCRLSSRPSRMNLARRGCGKRMPLDGHAAT